MKRAKYKIDVHGGLFDCTNSFVVTIEVEDKEDCKSMAFREKLYSILNERHKPYVVDGLPYFLEMEKENAVN